VRIDKKSTGGPPAHKGQPLIDTLSCEFRVFQQRACQTYRRSEETAVTVARQRKVEIQEYAVGAQPCDTRRSAFRPRTVQENAGYTLDMAVTGSLETHQAVVHHGAANEVVVAAALNSEMCDENVWF